MMEMVLRQRNRPTSADVIVHACFFDIPLVIQLITCYHSKVIFRSFFIRNQIFLNIIIEADDISIHLMSPGNGQYHLKILCSLQESIYSLIYCIKYI
jgi:hypothetical protein